MSDPLVDLRNVVERLASSLERLEQTLVRKDVYEVNERARTAEIDGIRRSVRDLDRDLEEAEKKREQEKKDSEVQRRADRRLLLTAFVAPFLLILVQLYIAAQFGGGA